MMGIKSFQEKMFYNFSLSTRIPEDHFLRKANQIIDISFVRTLVSDKYSHTGQPSIDPEVLFKMMLIGYFYGITSERRLAEEATRESREEMRLLAAHLQSVREEERSLVAREIHDELGRLFEFVHLRPFTFESPYRKAGYLGWSCFMRRPMVGRDTSPR